MTEPATRHRHVLVACVLAASAPVTAVAAWVGDGVMSLRTDVWSGDRQLDDRRAVGAASLWARGRIDGGAMGQVVANGWLRAQAPDDSEPDGRLRELYWRKTLGPFDLRLGRQMIVWGRADGLNPTDNLSPRDFRLLAPRDGDLRHGNEAAKVEASVPVGSVSFLWFPHAATDVIPLESVPGVRYGSEKPRAGQWALRWEFSSLRAGDQGDQGDGVDGSVSYFDGRDPLPDLTPAGLSATGLAVVLRNQPVKVLGADMSFTHDGVVWRVEAAATRTASQGADDFSRKRPQFWAVGGGEWSWPGSTTLGLQATLRHVEDFSDPARVQGPLQALARRQLATSGQSGRNQAGVLWRLARRLDNDSTTLETSGVALWSSAGGPASGLARVGADMALNDQWQLQVGAERYFGTRSTQFGQLRDNSLLYAQVRRGF